jgi:hypothetical protein
MLQQYRVLITSRDYSAWHLVTDDTYRPVALPPGAEELNPAEQKLFSRDMITLSPFRLVHSPTRTLQIPGVLILEGNRTYGRTDNLKRLLYKCVPNDRYLPPFLVPFQPDVGFSKRFVNRFVVIEFAAWDRQHPLGTLKENLGTVDNLHAFCEYQLYCRNIHESLASFKASGQLAQLHGDPMQHVIANPAYQIAPRVPSEEGRHPTVFSIDPKDATDFDDAFSVTPYSDTRCRVSIYISNVFAVLDHYSLWRSFSNRVATIYLPDSKRPMLPDVLSEKCSLRKGFPRVAFCMEVDVDESTGTLLTDTATFNNQVVVVSHNFAYDSDALLQSTPYQRLLRLTQALDLSVTDSTDVVSFWMIQMNSLCGQLLQQKGVGIFREVSFHPNTPLSSRSPSPPPPPSPSPSSSDSSTAVNLTAVKPTTPPSGPPAAPTDVLPPVLLLPKVTQQLLQNWKQTSGQYTLYHEGMRGDHVVLRRTFYAHITSPIRRLIDLLNQIMFMSAYGTADVSFEAKDFLQSWLARMDFVNTAMRSIRKVQVDCDMLHKCTVHPEWIEQEHRGVPFDRLQRADGLYKYMVHLVDLNLLARFTSPLCLDEHCVQMFHIFVFEDADRLQRKIRVAPVCA